MSTVTIGGVVIAATEISDGGGWNAPSKRTEEGFEYQSYVRAEPLEASVQGWIRTEDYRALENLRESGEPFSASVGKVSLKKAKLNSLDRTQQQGTSSHLKVSVTVSEIQEARIETAEISIETESGASLGTAASDTEPSNAQPEDESGGQTEEETGGIVGALSGFRESLSGVFS